VRLHFQFQLDPQETDNARRHRGKTSSVSFFVNYVAHVMTVISMPGETVSTGAVYRLVAFLFPFAGAWRGIRSIKLATIFAPNKLEQAARAGALCVVARSRDWKPVGEELVSTCTMPNKALDRQEMQKPHFASQRFHDAELEPINPKETRIHGQCFLPYGYCLVRLPSDAMVSPQEEGPLGISSSQSTVKPMVAILQLLLSCAALYRAQGAEIERYGYAAFSLTVIPYTLMSFINLAGSLITPEYPACYFLRSQAMDEAIARGGRFDGAIGRVQIMDSECLRRLDDVDSGGSVSGNCTPYMTSCAMGGVREDREVNVFTGRSSFRRDSSGCQIVAPAVDPYPVRLSLDQNKCCLF
jgi:hypothetical protein